MIRENVRPGIRTLRRHRMALTAEFTVGPSKHIDRRGPGLIASMSRSAILTGRRGLERPGEGRRSRSTERAARASDQYRQLCDLVEDGVLNAAEFRSAVGRLTIGFAHGRHGRGSWTSLGSATEEDGHERRAH